MKVNDIREYFRNELKEERFTVDRNGHKTIEMLGASFIADEPAIFGTPNEDYIKNEIDWYLSQSTNINDIYVDGREPPKAWKMTADKNGEINSNYGHLIFSPIYYNQFFSAVTELIENPDSRRAIMIYNRPSMQFEYKDGGKNDFICTNAHTYYIRDNRLHVVVQMRSNDVVFGYKNDRAWAQYVLGMFQCNLIQAGVHVKLGNIYWQVQNLHVYSRHFNLVNNDE